MARSMTAFGAARQSSVIGTCRVEIQSVNRRFLELSLSMPKELSSYEKQVRKELEKFALRGAVQCSVRLELEDTSAFRVSVHTALAKGLASAWKKLFEEVGISRAEESLPSLLLQQGDRLLTWEKNEEVHASLETLLFQTLSQAGREFCVMKEQEGKILAQDLFERCEKIAEIVRNIEGNKKTLREEMQAKLLAKVSQEWTENVPAQEILVKEVCQIVEKSDITEELVRLQSHLEQCKEVLRSEEAVGKKLEFISQELLRETNTIGSKVLDLSTTRLVIEIKTEIERIRQQIQNIE